MNGRNLFGYTLAIFAIGILLGGIAMSKSNFTPLQWDANSEKITWQEEVIATNLAIPWDVAEEPEGRVLITERAGALKVMEKDGSIKTIAMIPVAVVSESGLTGIALHPNYAENSYLYLYYTYRDAGELMNKVVRYTLRGEVLTEDKTILDRLAGGQIHNGGRLRFGPDGKLYVLTGDGARPELAQDPNNLAGKVLRVNDDGTVPMDNPSVGSPVYSLGHRNPQGLTWHALTEQLFVNEHGETAHDELNLIQPGKNYAWGAKDQSGAQHDPKFVDPILESGRETWAPSGISSYPDRWSLRNTVFMASLRGETLFKVDIINGKVQKTERMLEHKYGRLRAVYVLRDGSILITTSNKDGRNMNPSVQDDRIIKLTPSK
jgi:glucose/arabinose dehydrogenase